MYKFAFILLSTVALGSAELYGQCDSSNILRASKTSYFDSTGKETRVIDEATEIIFDKTSFKVISGENREMNGVIKAYECNWSIKHRTGMSKLNVVLSQDGVDRALSIEITGKDGIITLNALIDNDPNKRVQLIADSFGYSK